jgi:hypothetical protein
LVVVVSELLQAAVNAAMANMPAVKERATDLAEFIL